MSRCHGIPGTALQGYLEIGDMDRAEEFFNKSWLPYVDYKTGDFGGDCGGNFLTGAGGFLQGLWAGWAGIRLRENSLDFRESRVAATCSLRRQCQAVASDSADMCARLPAGAIGVAVQSHPVYQPRLPV